jgi:hypothetical protein
MVSLTGGGVENASEWNGFPVSRLAECPKLMSNGPCAGVQPNGGCEVEHGTPCVWCQAAAIAPEQLLVVRPPAEWAKDGERQWTNVFSATGPSVLEAVRLLPDKEARAPRAEGRLERSLREGRFAVTVQMDPPDGPHPQAMLERLQSLHGQVDAVHVTDNRQAAPRLSALAFAGLLERAGMESILHLTCRDRNRLMLQADLLGAAAMGVKNVVCLTGEHPHSGSHFESKPVFDLDSISLLSLARRMRDEAQLWNGRALENPPRVFLGAGAEMSEPFDYRPRRLATKAAAGCDFAVTQALTQLGRLPEYLGLDRKLYLLVSVGVLNQVPEAEAEAQCARLLHAVRELPGVSGVAIAANSPEQVLRLIRQSELMRPGAGGPGAGGPEAGGMRTHVRDRQ